MRKAGHSQPHFLATSGWLKELSEWFDREGLHDSNGLAHHETSCCAPQGKESEKTVLEVVSDHRSLKGILPIAKSIFTSWGFEWALPGHGEAYSDCGSWRSKGCLNVEEHNQQGIFEDMVGKVFVKRYRRTCMRAECPTCYESWAGKEAGKIEYRLGFARPKRRPIHLIVSPPDSAVCSMDLVGLRRKSYAIAKKSGFLGGSCIFHPYREDELTKKWYFSPHFHMIGYGWIEHTKEGYESHGWVVKNAGLRKTVSGTALYQLSHAGIHEKYHTVTWFGTCSYNNMRIPPRPEEVELCPICKQKLRPLWYFGEEELPEEVGEYWMEVGDPPCWMYKPEYREF